MTILRSQPNVSNSFLRIEEFTVDRKKLNWLTALACACGLVCAARNGAGAEQFAAKSSATQMNVPSWSPDGRELAFVSYQLVPKGL